MLPLSDIQWFCFIFPFVYLTLFSNMAKLLSTFCSEWSSFNCSNFSTGMMSLFFGLFFFAKQNKIPGNKESLSVLNHFIYILSIYLCTIYNDLFAARAVSTSYSAWASHCRWVKILGWLRPWWKGCFNCCGLDHIRKGCRAVLPAAVLGNVQFPLPESWQQGEVSQTSRD